MEINGGIIHRIYDKCKDILADDLLYFCLILCFVALSSFGLGRLSVKEITNTTTKTASVAPVIKKEPVKTAESSASPSDIYYVGSKNSDKYHLPDCPGVDRIAEENKITWSTKEEAEAAGYAPALNCEGL